jgi:hypothetical protein
MKIIKPMMTLALEATTTSVIDAIEIVDKAFGADVANKAELVVSVMNAISNYYLAAMIDGSFTDLNDTIGNRV